MRRFLPDTDQVLYGMGLLTGCPALMMLICRTLGLSLAPTMFVLLYIILCGLLLTKLLGVRWEGDNHEVNEAIFSAILGGLACIAAVFIKLWTVRDLQVGFWGDSLQHTMIAQLLVDHGGLFDSWMPYAPLSTFTYHYGFHADVALFNFITGMPVARATLVMGQLMQVASMISVGAFTTGLLFRSEGVSLRLAYVAGFIALLLTGFVNLMPTYFVNWGRYTQLAGQVILPATVMAWIDLAMEHDSTVRRSILAGVLTACLFLTHYLVTLFAATSLLVFLGVVLITKTPLIRAKTLIYRGALGLGITGLLVLPWVRTTIASSMINLFTEPASSTAVVQQSNIIHGMQLQSISPQYIKGWLMGLALAGCVLAMRRRVWGMGQLGLWAVALILLVTPATLGLPGTGIIDYLTAYIALYVYLMPLAAYALAACLEYAEGLHLKGPMLMKGFLTAVGAITILWSAQWQVRVLEPENFQLFDTNDAAAMEWVKANTPSTARFFVNGFPAYGGSLVAGNDGGWWLQFLTLHETILPPLTYGVENGPTQGYRREVNAVFEGVRGLSLREGGARKLDLTLPTNLSTLAKLGITHIYASEHVQPAESDQIDIARLVASPAFREVFSSGDVHVFEIITAH